MRKSKYIEIFILGIVVGILIIGILKWIGIDISLTNIMSLERA